MERLKHRLLGLMLAIMFFGACEQDTEVQRRSISQTDAFGEIQSSNVDSTSPEEAKNPDMTYETIDPEFRPDDPNTFSRKPGVAFPAVSFTIEGIPSGQSDRYNYTLPVKADPSISHYAYKIDTAATCDKTGGYTVGEAKNPIVLSLDKFPMGPMHLCVIAFHFPTRQWQDLTKALNYNWEKIVFKRTFDSYYEFVDSGCKTTARYTAKLTIEGEGGSYDWQRVPVQGCRSDPNAYTDLISMVKVNETGMEGAWHEGTTVAGWFKFTWTNPERTSFKGTWGYGAPGVKSEGVWNSIDN